MILGGYQFREPSSDQCTHRESVDVVLVSTGEKQRAFAIWYPQMGGYSSHAIVLLGEGDDCFDVFVWHDGEFPFSEDSTPGASPAHLHHCDPEQFVRFGEAVIELQEAAR